VSAPRTYVDLGGRPGFVAYKYPYLPLYAFPHITVPCHDHDAVYERARAGWFAWKFWWRR